MASIPDPPKLPEGYIAKWDEEYQSMSHPQNVNTGCVPLHFKYVKKKELQP